MEAGFLKRDLCPNCEFAGIADEYTIINCSACGKRRQNGGVGGHMGKSIGTMVVRVGGKTYEALKYEKGVGVFMPTT